MVSVASDEGRKVMADLPGLLTELKSVSDETYTAAANADAGLMEASMKAGTEVEAKLTGRIDELKRVAAGAGPDVAADTSISS